MGLSIYSLFTSPLHVINESNSQQELVETEFQNGIDAALLMNRLQIAFQFDGENKSLKQLNSRRNLLSEPPKQELETMDLGVEYKSTPSFPE